MKVVTEIWREKQTGIGEMKERFEEIKMKVVAEIWVKKRDGDLGDDGRMGGDKNIDIQ